MAGMERHDFASFEIRVDNGQWEIVNEEGAPMAAGEGGKRDAVLWMGRMLAWLVDAMKRQNRGPLQ
jgi:hypothetical protein